MSERGFSLIELVAAMAIFAILTVMTQQALIHAVRNDDVIAGHRAALVELQRDMDRLGRDLRNIAPFAAQGRGEDAAVFALSDGEIGFTRGGLSAPFDQPRSTLVRVSLGWSSQHDGIERVARDALSDGDEPRRELLLAGEVTGLQFRAYDAAQGWQTFWPLDEEGAQALPAGVELVIETKSFGTLRRVVSLK